MSRWVAIVILLAVTSALCGGCSASAGVPRSRLGSLPFPGIFSLYEEADPEDLGVHCAGTPLARLGAKGEKERGTLYTARAGFIDVSHMRESIDWVQFLHGQLLAAMRAMDAGGAAPAIEFDYCSSDFEVCIVRPGFWGMLSVDERERLIEEASLVAAQRLSIVATTWHEIATWYGFQTVPGVSERGSAFTWDDTTAHVLGALVGGRAVRDISRDWDHAVTVALDEEIESLDVVDRAEFHATAMLVRDRWWKNFVAVKRDLDVGLRHDAKTPWLVPGAGHAQPIRVPSLANVRGRDLRGMVTFRIGPPWWMKKKVLALADGQEAVVSGEAGLLAAVELVRAHMRKEFGEGFDQP